MSHPSYPTYKPSGIEWLGDIPDHWQLKPAKAFMTRKAERGFPDATLLSVYRDYGVIEKASRDDNFNRAADDLSNYLLVEKGDLVFNKMKVWQGSLGVSPHRGIVSPAYYTCSISGDIHGEYLHYLLRSATYIPEYRRLSSGIRPQQWDLDYDSFKQIPLVVPSLAEQRTIAAFLDRETLRIDRLIEKQEQLIKLLEEKRQAEISHAVTKGLNPDAPMKDSGIEGLGHVPSHWQLKRIKHVVSRVVDCLHKTPTYEGDLQYPAVRTADIDRGVLLADQMRLVNHKVYLERIQRERPMPGDILYSREGERFGMAALVPDGLELCLGQRMMMFRVQNFMCPAFFMWQMNSDLVLEQVGLSTGGSTSPHINIRDIINFSIVQPPKEEQAAISLYIETKTKAFDTLKDKVREKISLLAEHRSSLISAAVTGKIDVRDLATIASEEAA